MNEKKRIEIADLIRRGLSSDKLKENIQKGLYKEASSEEIREITKMVRDFEKGKLKLTLTPEDRHRILDNHLKLFVKLDYEGEELDEMMNDVKADLEAFARKIKK